MPKGKMSDRIKAHPAVEYYGGENDHHFIELKPGYWHKELQARSFANNNTRQANQELKHVEKIPEDDRTRW